MSKRLISTNVSRRNFLKSNEATVVAFDKTKRLCVTSVSDIDNRTENILKDEGTYKCLPKSKKKKL